MGAAAAIIVGRMQSNSVRHQADSDAMLESRAARRGAYRSFLNELDNLIAAIYDLWDDPSDENKRRYRAAIVEVRHHQASIEVEAPQLVVDAIDIAVNSIDMFAEVPRGGGTADFYQRVIASGLADTENPEHAEMLAALRTLDRSILDVGHARDGLLASATAAMHDIRKMVTGMMRADLHDNAFPIGSSGGS